MTKRDNIIFCAITVAVIFIVGGCLLWSHISKQTVHGDEMNEEKQMELHQWLLVLITAMLTAITYLMYTSSIRSEVVVYLRLDRYLVFICVENIGKGAARDIRFEFPCSFKIHGGRTLNDINFFDKGIAILPPGHKKEIFVASYAGGNDQVLKQKPIEITIHYNRKKTTCNIDFDEFRGIAVVGEPPLDKMAKSIEKIQENLSRLMKKL